MKKLLLGSFAILALAAGPATAADLPVKAAPMAPAYVAPANWTGLYINGGFGYGMWTADTTTITPTTGVCFLCVPQRQGGRGWLGTVGVGLDYQFSDRIVAGALVDFDFSSLKGTIQDQLPFFAGEIKQNWAWSAGARIGWLVTPQILSYVNGGFSETHFTSATMASTFTPPTPLGLGFSTPAFTKSGWFIGGGMEAMFAPGWFWRSEYRYADYGTVNLTDTCPGTIATCGTFAPAQNTITFHPIVQTIRSEIVYKFNWAGPVRAAY